MINANTGWSDSILFTVWRLPAVQHESATLVLSQKFRVMGYIYVVILYSIWLLTMKKGVIEYFDDW